MLKRIVKMFGAKAILEAALDVLVGDPNKTSPIENVIDKIADPEIERKIDKAYGTYKEAVQVWREKNARS